MAGPGPGRGAGEAEHPSLRPTWLKQWGEGGAREVEGVRQWGGHPYLGAGRDREATYTLRRK